MSFYVVHYCCGHWMSSNAVYVRYLGDTGGLYFAIPLIMLRKWFALSNGSKMLL